jgi:large-conductance mechanosensitive channel
MFLTLLVITFIVSTVVSVIVARAFSKPIGQILTRIIADEISVAWRRYLMFALYVVGISRGVRIWDLEKYITPPTQSAQIVQLTTDRWILEVYRTVIDTLQGVAWVLLVFFIFALLAFVVVRVFEMRKPKKDSSCQESAGEKPPRIGSSC